MAADSNHVDDEGNFSIEVIKKSLTNFGLQCISLKAQEILTKEGQDTLPLEQRDGYICNYKNHWLTLRKIGGQWLNLNSVNAYGPEHVSDFYLGAFLKQLVNDGYSIFVVIGQYPPPMITGERGQTFSLQTILDRAASSRCRSQSMGKTGAPPLHVKLQRPTPPTFPPTKRAETEAEWINRAIALSMEDLNRNSVSSLKHVSGRRDVNTSAASTRSNSTQVTVNVPAENGAAAGTPALMTTEVGMSVESDEIDDDAEEEARALELSLAPHGTSTPTI
jgi:hypothetical protein